MKYDYINRFRLFFRQHGKWLVFFIIVILLILINVSKSMFFALDPTLKVTPNLPGSKIIVTSDNYFKEKSDYFEEEIPTGLYTIKVTKEGYISEERQIYLEKNTSLEIVLIKLGLTDIQSSYKQIMITPLSNNLTKVDDSIYSISRINRNLIRIEKDGSETTIYSGLVKDYAVSNNQIVIIEENEPSTIRLINAISLEEKAINFRDLTSIISIDIHLDKVYLLGNFILKDKKSTIVEFDLSKNSNIILGDTYSQKVRYINDKYLLLHQDNHDEDLNLIHFFDLNSKKIELSKSTNKYLLSPNKQYLFLHRLSSFVIIKMDTLQTNTSGRVATSSRAIWKDNNTIYLFRNNDGNSYYSKITIDPFKIEPFVLLLENVSVQNVFGVIDNRIYLQDYDEKIFSIIL